MSEPNRPRDPPAKSRERRRRTLPWLLVLGVLAVTWVLMALAIRWAVQSGKF